MSEENAPGPPPVGRVSTGCEGLDRMLEGGLVPRRPYLIVGPSGTGKTTLSLQFLAEGVRRGERCLFVTLEEPPNEIRVNHRGVGAELDEVEVFDAIPDIMRYERVPFKDIASVRAVTPFKHVPLGIRRSPELSAVEVTMTALEQMLRTEVVRRGYSRVVVDSLTALQYFCMKGFDPVAGAQAFLRFLSDLHVTSIITVESPLEDVETAERMLARGEVRLFRWELEERTVRAIGVEKFRGSPHDVRLHPYRIGSRGISINLEVTISRDTRQIIEPMHVTVVAVPAPTPIPLESVISPVDPLAEQVRDLVLVGADVGPVRTEIEAALGAATAGEVDRARSHLSRASALLMALSDSTREVWRGARPSEPEVAEAYQRLVQRGEAARAGLPPTKLPPPKVLEVQLEWVLSLIPAAAETPGAPEPALAEEVEALLSPGAAAPLEPRTPGAVPSATVAPAVLPPTPPAIPVPAEIVPAVAPLPESVPPHQMEKPAEVAPDLESIPPQTPVAPSPNPPTVSPSLAEVRPPSPEPVPAALSPAPPMPSPDETPPTRVPPPRVVAGPSSPVARVHPPEVRPPLPTVVTSRVPPSGEVRGPEPASSPAVTIREAIPEAAGLPTVPAEGTVPKTAAPAAAAAAPKRRRKVSSTARRKAPPPSTSPSGEPIATPTPSEVATMSPSEAPLSTSPKPKRRTGRKRRAPSVLAATPGAIPPGVLGAEPGQTPESRPPPEGSSGPTEGE